jgi:hypothetical protein
MEHNKHKAPELRQVLILFVPIRFFSSLYTVIMSLNVLAIVLLSYFSNILLVYFIFRFNMLSYCLTQVEKKLLYLRQ